MHDTPSKVQLALQKLKSLKLTIFSGHYGSFRYDTMRQEK